MGNTQSSAQRETSAPAASIGGATEAPTSSCPVMGSSSEPQSRCPVPESARSRGIYNVYGQRIDLPQPQGPADPLAALRATDVLDPKNNMPLAANQQPCPGQRKLLSTERIESNIPKGGTHATWVYPSPQMFFNGERWQQTQLKCQGMAAHVPSYASNPTIRISGHTILSILASEDTPDLMLTACGMLCMLCMLCVPRHPPCSAQTEGQGPRCAGGGHGGCGARTQQ